MRAPALSALLPPRAHSAAGWPGWPGPLALPTMLLRAFLSLLPTPISSTHFFRHTIPRFLLAAAACCRYSEAIGLHPDKDTLRLLHSNRSLAYCKVLPLGRAGRRRVWMGQQSWVRHGARPVP